MTKRPPQNPKTQVLHLRPSAGTTRRVNNLIQAARADHDAGSMRPEHAEEIRDEFRRTHQRFMEFLANLEQRGKR